MRLLDMENRGARSSIFSLTKCPLSEVYWHASIFSDDILCETNRPVIIRMVGTIKEVAFIARLMDPPFHLLTADYLRLSDFRAAVELVHCCSAGVVLPSLYFMTSTNLETAYRVSLSSQSFCHQSHVL